MDSGQRPTQKKSIVLVVSPLNALIRDQVTKLKQSGLKACILKGDHVEWEEEERKEEQEGLAFSAIENLKEFQLIFAHPEALEGNKNVIKLLKTAEFKNRMKATVVDEAHLVVDWWVLHVYVVVYFFISGNFSFSFVVGYGYHMPIFWDKKLTTTYIYKYISLTADSTVSAFWASSVQCWCLGWRLSLKSHPKCPTHVVHLSHARVLKLASDVTGQIWFRVKFFNLGWFSVFFVP